MDIILNSRFFLIFRSYLRYILFWFSRLDHEGLLLNRLNLFIYWVIILIKIFQIFFLLTIVLKLSLFLRRRLPVNLSYFRRNMLFFSRFVTNLSDTRGINRLPHLDFKRSKLSIISRIPITDDFWRFHLLFL